MSTHAYTRGTREHGGRAVIKPREMDPASRLGLQHPAPSGIIQRAALCPESLRPTDVVRLQQTLGNRAVGTLLNRAVSARPLIQAKLTVNAPGDEYEREADRVAEAVMRMPAVQRADVEEEDEEPEVMTKRAPPHAAGGAFEAGEEFEQELRTTRGHGQPLPPALRQEFENKFGADFSGVRVHTDSQSAEMNRTIQARAFTHGRDIYLGTGQHEPRSAAGKRLLAHELTHVIQQSGGTQGGGIIQRDVGFEFQTIWGIRKRIRKRSGALGYRRYRRQEVLRDRGDFEITADEANTDLGAEIEFRIKHVRENDRGALDTAMTRLETLARDLNRQKDRTMFRLDEVTLNPADGSTEVFPGIKSRLTELKANPQTTAGVRLVKMTQLFQDLDHPAGAHANVQQELVGGGGGGALGNAAADVANLQFNGAPASIRLKGLVALLITYLRMGRVTAGPGINQPPLNYAKASLTLLARTDFRRMFHSLSRGERSYYQNHPTQFRRLVLAAEGSGLDPNAGVLERTVRGQQINLSRKDWLEHIATDRDLLKKATSRLLFGFGGKGSKRDVLDGNRHGMIIEFRTMRREVPWQQWKPLALETFDYIVQLNQ